MAPYLMMAWAAYSEQVGVNLHTGGVYREIFWYTRMKPTITLRIWP